MPLNKEQSLDAYRLMVLIRRFEEKCAEHYQLGDIGGFLHLYIGQEAIAAAAKYGPRDDDNLITAYRDHGLALARDLPAKLLLAEMMGKQTGVSKGKGGSMHLADVTKRFWGGYAIVGGHLPMASGLALADQYQGNDRATLCFMGDGSTNIGYFHEALNLAGVWDLPVVWVVENNEYGMGTTVERASAVTEITKKAGAYDMPSEVVDGGDLNATADAFNRAADYARSGKGSYFLEVQTYRFRGHSMGDPERYRDPEEIEDRRKLDPIDRWRDHIIGEGFGTQEDLDALEESAVEEVLEAVKFALESPLPAPEELYTDVYAS